MHIYLSKKVAVPNETKLSSISWNSRRHCIACGGEDGMLKIIGFGPPSANSFVLTSNQSLEGHRGAVIFLAWNECRDKLASSDKNGLIIVWGWHDGQWHEDMINNRNKTPVCNMQWSLNKSMIGIAYIDGTVTIGGVDGNRIWTTKVQRKLSYLQWTSRDQVVLLDETNSFLFYDHKGSKIKEVDFESSSRISTFHIRKSLDSRSAHSLPYIAVVMDNGTIKIHAEELSSKNFICIETNIDDPAFCWTGQADNFIVCGYQFATNGRDTNTSSNRVIVLKCFDLFGRQLAHLKVASDHSYIKPYLAWDELGLGAACAVGSSIYFAVVRKKFKFGITADVFVFEEEEQDKAAPTRLPTGNVVFVDKKKRYFRRLSFPNLTGLSVSTNDSIILIRAVGSLLKEHCIVYLCDSIGGFIDTCTMNLRPRCFCSSSKYVVVSDGMRFSCWKYNGKKEEKSPEIHSSEEIFNVVVISAAPDYLASIDELGMLRLLAYETFQVKVAIDLKLKNVTTIKFNNDCSCMGILGADSSIKIISFNDQDGIRTRFESKDCWNIIFSEITSFNFLLAEQNNMRLCSLEEPLQSNSTIFTSNGEYLLSLNQNICSVDLDKVHSLEHPFDFETLVRRTSLLSVTGDKLDSNIDSEQLVRALTAQNLELTEKLLCKKRDYQGLCFLRRLKKYPAGSNRQKCEIAIYLKDFNVAESYMNLEEAIMLRISLGDWSRVLELIEDATKSGVDLTRALIHRIAELSKDQFRRDIANMLHEKVLKYGNGINSKNSKEKVTKLHRTADLLLASESKCASPSNFQQAHSTYFSEVTADNNHGLRQAAEYFCGLAHRFFYSGDMENSLKTAIRCVCVDYERYVDKKTLYSLLCITSFCLKSLKILEIALLALEKTIKGEYGEQPKEIQELSVQLLRFSSETTRANGQNRFEFYESALVKKIPYTICLVTGSFVNVDDSFKCASCGNRISNDSLSISINCPLCNSKLSK